MRIHWTGRDRLGDRWFRSLSARIWFTAVGTLAAMLILLSLIVTYVFNHFPEETLGGHEQSETVEALVRGLRFDDAGQPVSVQLPPESVWLFEALRTEVKYRIFDAQGRILLASPGERQGAPWGDATPASKAGTVYRASIGDRPFDLMTRSVAHGAATYFVQTATSMQFMHTIIGEKTRPIHVIVRIVILVAMMTFALTLAGIVCSMMKPLREASRAAASITPRNLTTRLSLEGLPSEITPLIAAFNDALGRLENGFKVQQQFLASAAHELQTPLTLVRGQIELQEDIADKDLLLREIDMMSRQVRQLLHLAEVSESQNFTFGSVQPGDVVQEVIDYLSRKAEARQVTLLMSASDACTPVWADRGALFILLKNIVENAINVTPAHHAVSVTIDDASIHVRDEGPGIASEHLPFLFKRFWRAPDAKHDGAGLGLAICKEISLAHEWRLTVSSLAPGTRFSVWF